MSESQYRSGIRAAVRGLWVGALSLDDFFQSMDSTIRSQLRRAFIEGAAKCGIVPAEFTQDERIAMRRGIQNELSFIWSFGLAIEAGNKASGGKLGPHFQRSEAWIVRYREAVNRASVMTCANKKLIWRLGATEQHCGTCNKLDGKVKRADSWQEIGVLPQNAPNPLLECGGWRCLCTLTPTDLPASKGPLPRVP
jgi:hypothetical protein